MNGEPDHSTEVETDNAVSDTDHSEDFDYFDPDEDHEEAEQPEETADETETEVEAEADEEAEAEAEEEESEEPSPPELHKLDDGSEVTIDELKSSFQRQAALTRKEQDVSNERKAVSANSERISNIVSALTDHLSNLIPPAPDVSLAVSDPNKFVAQKAQHEAALAAVQALIEQGDQAKSVTQSMSEADHKRLVDAENAKLAGLLPETGSEDGRKAFLARVLPAVETVGFTKDDMSKAIDHRLFALAHWAQKGMEAEQAKTKAKAKVEKAPPATPRKPGQGARQPNQNKTAMRKLAQTGRLEDALAIDFE